MKTRRRQNVSEDLQTVPRSNTRHGGSPNRPGGAIPIDLSIEILLKLPVKSIASCRCVSKLWDSIIRRPYFTELILNRSTARPQLLFACKRDGNVCFFSSSQPQNPDENSSPVPVSANYHMNFHFDGGTWQLYRPLQGLVCLKHMRYLNGKYIRVMVICNPSTGQSLTSPRVKTSRFHVSSFFGYDPIDKQFKVLSMTRSRFGTDPICEQHQVLTLGGTEKLSWRMIKCSLRHYPLCDGIYINGFLYYKARVYGFRSDYGIACFDVRSEKFEFIEKYVVTSKLVNYMGKLATLKRDNEFRVISGRTKSFELCVLEDSNKLEWSTRTFVLPALWNHVVADFELCIVGVTSTGEIVLSHSTDPFFLIYYNLERNTLTKVDIQGMDAFKDCIVHTFLDHVEDVKLGGVFRTT